MMEGFLDNVHKYAHFWEDIRKRLLSTVIICIVFFFIGCFSSGWVIKEFIKLFNIQNVIVVTTSPLQIGAVIMNIGLFFATLAAVPLLIYNIIGFVSPALTKKERWKLLSIIPVSFFLFVFGFAYGAAILYFSFQIFAQLNESIGLKNIWDIASFLSETCATSALLGLVFQFPIIISVLIRLGIVSTKQLKEKRRLAYFLVFVLVSLLPPTDGLSLIVMSLPLVLLYEGAIIFNFNKK